MTEKGQGRETHMGFSDNLEETEDLYLSKPQDTIRSHSHLTLYTVQ